jgi:hypothetical protein
LAEKEGVSLVTINNNAYENAASAYHLPAHDFLLFVFNLQFTAKTDSKAPAPSQHGWKFPREQAYRRFRK